MSHFGDVEWVKTTNRFHPDVAKSGKKAKKIKVTIEEVRPVDCSKTDNGPTRTMDRQYLPEVIFINFQMSR